MKSIRLVTDSTEIDTLHKMFSAPLTQGALYLDIQKSFARSSFAFVVEEHDKPIAYAVGYYYDLLFGKTVLYFPYGPVGAYTEVAAQEVEHFIKQHTLPDTVFVRFDSELPIEWGRPVSKRLYKSPFHQPRGQWLVDTNVEPDTMMATMKKRARYYVRQATKRGVVVEHIEHDIDRYFEKFCKLNQDLHNRKALGDHSKEYYRQWFVQTDRQVFLTIAYIDEEIVTINVNIKNAAELVHLFGATSELGLQNYSSYAALYAGMGYAYTHRHTTYNLGGLSTGQHYDSYLQTLNTFKTGFAGRMHLQTNFRDIVIDKWWYMLYRLKKLL